MLVRWATWVSVTKPKSASALDRLEHRLLPTVQLGHRPNLTLSASKTTRPIIVSTSSAAAHLGVDEVKQ